MKQMGLQITVVTLISGILFVSVHAPLFHGSPLNKHKFKDKVIKNLKMIRALNQMWVSSDCGALPPIQVTHP